MSLAFIAAVVVLVTASAQDTVTIPDRVACTDCSIETELLVTLGTSREGMLAGNMGEAVVKDHEGGYWLFSCDVDDQLWRFDPSGADRLVGQRGGGPGEYQSIDAIGRRPDGAILVRDHGNGRLNVLSASGSLVSSRPVRAAFLGVENLVAIGNDTVVIAGVGGSGAALGVPMHVVDMKDGTVVGTVGARPGTYEAQLTAQYRRRRVAYATGTLAAGHYWEYVVDYFDWPTGRREKTVRRSAPWFPSVDLKTVNPPRTRPASSIIAVRLLADGTLLTLTRRPRPNWLEGFEQSRPSGEGRTGLIYEKMYESVIEHLDVDGARVLSRTTLAGTPLALVDGALEVAILRDEDVVPTIEVRGIRLES